MIKKYLWRIYNIVPRIFVLAVAILILFFCAYGNTPKASASVNIGTISSTNKYAWSENIGWINFGADNGNVTVTDTQLTGYAWSENAGWISLNCSNDNSCVANPTYFVQNDGHGVLSGIAWSQNTGRINFSPSNGGVTINSSGQFSGYAWGENVGWINFSCTSSGCPVTTTWRQQCTSWTYSAWGNCSNSQQTRAILSSLPSGCTGGSPVLTQSCVGGGAGGAALALISTNPPIVPAGGFQVIINQGASTTSNRIVTLNFNAGSDTQRVAVSMTPDFSAASQQMYQPQMEWDLCPYTYGSVCPAGTYTVYVKFYTSWGQPSQAVSATITLTTNSVQGLQPTTLPPTNQPATSTGLFTQHLQFGSRNGQVVLLQNTLKKLGFFPQSANATGYFGPITLKAVEDFQVKNNIVAPSAPGYGQVGPKTRAVLNQQGQ